MRVDRTLQLSLFPAVLLVLFAPSPIVAGERVTAAEARQLSGAIKIPMEWQGEHIFLKARIRSHDLSLIIETSEQR